jgi:hypothetical protein
MRASTYLLSDFFFPSNQFNSLSLNLVIVTPALGKNMSPMNYVVAMRKAYNSLSTNFMGLIIARKVQGFGTLIHEDIICDSVRDINPTLLSGQEHILQN